jgi:hypothetical protein
MMAATDLASLHSALLGSHRQSQMGGLWTGIQPVHISVISKMVSDYSGMMVQPHKVNSSRKSSAPCMATHPSGCTQAIYQRYAYT